MFRRYLAIASIVLVPAGLTLAGGCSDDDPTCHDEEGCPSTHGAGGHGAEGGTGSGATGGDGSGAEGGTGTVGGAGGTGTVGGAGGAGGAG